jgi:hypothetical protein
LVAATPIVPQRTVSFNSHSLYDTQCHFTYNYWSHSNDLCERAEDNLPGPHSFRLSIFSRKWKRAISFSLNGYGECLSANHRVTTMFTPKNAAAAV